MLRFVRKSVSDPKACATACPKRVQIDTCASRDLAGAFFPRRFKELRPTDLGSPLTALQFVDGGAAHIDSMFVCQLV
jgi:hypothetical protein